MRSIHEHTACTVGVWICVRACASARAYARACARAPADRVDDVLVVAEGAGGLHGRVHPARVEGLPTGGEVCVCVSGGGEGEK